MLLGHYISIKSCSNDKYLSISNDGKIFFNQSDIKNSNILIMRYEGKYITLQEKSGKYISCNTYYNSLELNKDKNIIGDNERFEIEWINEDLFALKANNSFYISVQKDGKVDVNQKYISECEQFSMTEQKEESLMEFLNFVNYDKFDNIK